LENAQRRAPKLAPALRDPSSVERIAVLDLPSLYYRRARGDMIETYKQMTGIYAVDADYIKPDKGFQVKERKINEKYQATILQQQDVKFMEYVAC